MKNLLLAYCMLSMAFLSCEGPGGNPSSGGQNSGGSNSGSGSNTWLIPQSQVFDGGPGKDGIPALENPETTTVAATGYLSDTDLVMGYFHNGAYRAYPHKILDWHEIINDDLQDSKIAITYCPLTGTGIGWNRKIEGKETTFGVSGLLYNTNLIPYDRATDSNWCQISLECVNGQLSGTKIETFPIIETTWGTWKAMFPESSVLTRNTGFSRNYAFYPYGDYRTNDNSLLFPVDPMDDRLPAKERVLAVVVDEKAKVYRFDEFGGTRRLISDTFEDNELVIIGSKEENFIVAYVNDLNGSPQEYSMTSDANPLLIFRDAKGNKYDLFGTVVEGPDLGQKLTSIPSFMAYWFSVGAFYTDTQIFEDNG